MKGFGIPRSASTVMRITTLAVPAAMHYCMRMMLIISTDTTTAQNAITMKLIRAVVSTITATNPNRCSTAIVPDISA